MARIENYPVFNFSGGVRRDRSSFEFQKNELLDTRNIEFANPSRLRVRRGSFQLGQTLTGNTLENSFSWSRVVTGSSSATTRIFINDNDSTGQIWVLNSTRLTTALTTGSVTLDCITTSNFSASGIVEVNGDQITYTGGGGGGAQLTGVSGVSASHAAGASVNQWTALSLTTAMDNRMGVTYAVLNNVLVMCGRGGAWNQIANDDGTTTTAISGEPAGIFIQNYRDRLYVVGDGSNGTNGDTRRVSFSERGDGTSWSATNFFDVEDQRGEPLTALRVLNDRLLLFKMSSIFTFDEIELKQRDFNIGAYNNKVPIEINGLIYTFCPEGIFLTNGFQSKNIGEPVRQYWKNFRPILDSFASRVVTNTWATKNGHRYILYLYDITEPVSENDIALEYDTLNNTWTVHRGGYTDFFHMNQFNLFRFGDRLQYMTGLFGGNATGQFYRFYESKYRDNQSTQTNQGEDILRDLVTDDSGSIVSAYIETPLYDLTHPRLFKKFKNLRVYVEQGNWTVEYRFENERGVTAYKSLGKTTGQNTVFNFPSDTQGWRIGFRFSTVPSGNTPIFNGFVIENTEVDYRK